jgi:hypothetical protein
VGIFQTFRAFTGEETGVSLIEIAGAEDREGGIITPYLITQIFLPRESVRSILEPHKSLGRVKGAKDE